MQASRVGHCRLRLRPTVPHSLSTGAPARLRLGMRPHTWRLEERLASAGGTSRKGQARAGALVATQPPRDQGSSSKPFEFWMQDVVFDIVKHAQDAPFLHFVFDNMHGKGKPQRQLVEPDVIQRPELWNTVKDSVRQQAPDGVIFIHRLQPQENMDQACFYDCDVDPIANCSFVPDAHPGASGGSTNLWGIVVQRKSSRRHACYILKTTCIASAMGACTRFSLTRTTCGGPALLSQLESSWLV
eukprot:SM000020S06070  [mRNA]  locus=s20:897842:899093:+ [translate_table: standard]